MFFLSSHKSSHRICCNSIGISSTTFQGPAILWNNPKRDLICIMLHKWPYTCNFGEEEYGALLEWYWQRKGEVHRRKKNLPPRNEVWAIVGLFKTDIYLHFIHKTLIIPISTKSTSTTRMDQFIPFRKIIGVDWRNRITQTTTACGQNIRLLHVPTGGTSNNNWKIRF